jgi:UDP-N-acetylglucosamine 4,6-dehydratase/5-epimerase
MTLHGNILITGGTGTLGQAIIRRAEAEGWDCRFTVYSRGENLQAQMRQTFPRVRYVLGDVRDADRLTAAMAGHDTVIHAAAMKRIPEAEAQPSECYATNVTGSLNVARAAARAGVARVVGISTDKACAATTAYGASKLAMEKIFQAQPAGGPIFTLVRYGNVIASRGSVIPIWRGQAERGEPLTITDMRMTRFWMSVDEAVDLVLDGARARHGEIWVKKMAALPVAELAALIAPGAELREIGLRSDEKIHEDLVHPGEAVVDAAGHYVVASCGARGTTYRSDTAPRLTPAAFLDMLAAAEEAEYA